LLTDLGIALQLQGQSTAAIHAFEQALKLKSLPRTYALLAEEKCKIRDLDGARPMLKKIIRDYIQDAKTIAAVASCYLDLDEPLDSVRAYSVLLRDESYPHDLAMIQLSRSYLAAAQYFIARLKGRSDSAAYVSALDQASTSGDARSAFAIAEQASPNFHADWDFDAALAIWHQHQDDPTLLYQLAAVSGEQSIRQIELCSRQYPDSPYLAQLQFEVFADQGRRDEAEKGFEELLQSHPELPDLRHDLGMLFRKEHQWDKALTVFREELSANPKDERAAARVSEALDQLMRWTELRDFLTPRVEQGETPLWAVLDLAEAHEQLGEPRQAISLLSSAEAKYPSSRAVHFRLLHLYRDTGEKPRAFSEVDWLKSHPK
jgi:tetratricopeptide (TPR) repeat protein